MARLALGLEVTFIPEQMLVATVWGLVVAHQLAGIAHDPAAFLALAGEHVPLEDLEPKGLPPSRLVPALPWWSG